MPNITPITTTLNLETVQVGPAGTFRKTINDNFDKLKERVGEIAVTVNGIIENGLDNNSMILSVNKPGTGGDGGTKAQKQGDVWFKILS